MTQMSMILTPKVVAESVGLPPDSITGIAWLCMQEMAKGLTAAQLAVQLSSDESDLHALADSTTGGTGGTEGELWKACVTLCRAIQISNQNTVANGWDSLEAMAVNRLVGFVADSGKNLTVKDAVAVAQLANKATRRAYGEGLPTPTRIGITPPAGGGGAGLELELHGGNLGSIKLSLTQRVQQQLATPRTIDAEPVDRVERKMLSLDETRKLVDGL